VPRLFIGLVVPESVGGPLTALAEGALREVEGVTCRRYPPRDLHLTLCFLGEHPGGARLESALQDETRGLYAPELYLAGTGTFPDAGPPRVLWVGVREDLGLEGRLAALHNRVSTAAMVAGWRAAPADRTRPFLPHLTLARWGKATQGSQARSAGAGAPERGDPGHAAALRAFSALRPRGSWIASEVVLFESDPSRPEQRYRPLLEVPLAVRPG